MSQQLSFLTLYIPPSTKDLPHDLLLEVKSTIVWCGVLMADFKVYYILN